MKVGGESDQQSAPARPCPVEWQRALRDCFRSDAAVFIKQLGSRPTKSAPCKLSRAGGAEVLSGVRPGMRGEKEVADHANSVGRGAPWHAGRESIGLRQLQMCKRCALACGERKEMKLEWVEVSGDRIALYSRNGRYLWVVDGTHSSASVLPSSMSIRDALENFAESHLIGTEKREVTLTFQMWHDGEIKVSGKQTFEVNTWGCD